MAEDNDRVDKLKDWMRRDRDIAMIVRATLNQTDSDTVDALAADQPVLFDELYDSIEAMITDIPIHEPPGWAR